MSRQLFPLVSFVVVTHDRDARIVRDRILHSIAAQRYPRKELILVGEDRPEVGVLLEGLPNGEFERIEAFSIPRERDDKFCVWELVCRARNAGIRAAAGEYVCCQDDDNELLPHFTAAMAALLQRTGADAGWCWREIRYPDGAPFRADRFPWIVGDEHRAALAHELWVAAGIFEPGSAVVRDTLWAKRGAETFCTVDANEWLVRRDAYALVPFPERYSYLELMYHVTFDDIWAQRFCAAGLTAAPLNEVGLRYYLGGASNRLEQADDERDIKR